MTGASGKALTVIEKAARKNGSGLVKVNTQKGPLGNQSLAKIALETLGIKVSEASMKKAFKEGFPGRFEEVDAGVILDGAHNPDKIEVLINFVKNSKLQIPNSKITLVIAFKKGKKWKKMIDLLIKNLPVKQVIATEFNAVTDTGKFSAVPAEEIAKYIKSKSKVKVESQGNPQEAVFVALNSSVIASEAKQSQKQIAAGSSNHRNDSRVLVTGSLYLVGEVRTMWKLPKV